MQEEIAKNDEVFLTSNTKLATALLCLGHTLRRPPCTRQVRRDGRTIVTFLFNPATEGATDSCGKLASQWLRLEEADPGERTPEDLEKRVTWLKGLAESDDALEFAYANAGWRDICLSIVKSTPRMVEVTAGNGFGFIREDASPDEIRKMQNYL
jgi:hypothetical protein